MRPDLHPKQMFLAARYVVEVLAAVHHFTTPSCQHSLPQPEAAPLDEDEQLDLIYGADHLAAVVKPVAVTMAIASCVVQCRVCEEVAEVDHNATAQVGRGQCEDSG